MNEKLLLDQGWIQRRDSLRRTLWRSSGRRSVSNMMNGASIPVLGSPGRSSEASQGCDPMAHSLGILALRSTRP